MILLPVVRKTKSHYQKIVDFLKQPYPHGATRFKNIRVIIGICVFVFLFLFFFQPFGLEYLGSDDLILRIGGNVLFIFIALLFNFFLLPKVFNRLFSEEHWTVLNSLVFALYNLIFIGACCLFYASIRGNVPLSFGNFLHFVFYSILIGGIPFTFVLLLNHVRELRKHIKMAENLNSGLKNSHYSRDEKLITLTSENGKDHKKIRAESLILLASADNYVTIVLDHGNQIKKELFRNTLTRMAADLNQYPEFFRCHRSYIVNLRKIKKVTGSSLGFKLIIDHLNDQIPVARSQSKHFRSKMKAVLQLDGGPGD